MFAATPQYRRQTNNKNYQQNIPLVSELLTPAMLNSKCTQYYQISQQLPRSKPQDISFTERKLNTHTPTELQQSTALTVRPRRHSSVVHSEQGINRLYDEICSLKSENRLLKQQLKSKTLDQETLGVLKDLQLKYEELSFKYYESIDDLKERENRIQILSQRLLQREDECHKLHTINMLLKEKIRQEVKLVEEHSKNIIVNEAKLYSNMTADHLNSMHTRYNSQLDDMRKQLQQNKEAVRAMRQLHQQELQRLRQQKDSLELELNKQKELNRIRETAELSAKSEEFERWLEKVWQRLNNSENMISIQYEKHLNHLRSLILKECSHNSNIDRMFEKQLADFQKMDHLTKVKLSRLDAQCDLLAKTVEELNASNKELAKKIEDKDNQIVSLKNEQKKFADSKKEWKEFSRMREQKLEELLKENMDLKLQLDGSRKLEAQNFSLEQQINSLENLNKELQQRLVVQQKHANIGLAEAQSQIYQLKIQNNQLTEAKHSLQVEISKANKELDDLKSIVQQQGEQQLQTLSLRRMQKENCEVGPMPEPQQVYCKLKNLQRDYEKLSSEMVSMKTVMKIANKASRRYQR